MVSPTHDPNAIRWRLAPISGAVTKTAAARPSADGHRVIPRRNSASLVSGRRSPACQCGRIRRPARGPCDLTRVRHRSGFADAHRPRHGRRRANPDPCFVRSDMTEHWPGEEIRRAGLDRRKRERRRRRLLRRSRRGRWRRGGRCLSEGLRGGARGEEREEFFAGHGGEMGRLQWCAQAGNALVRAAPRAIKIRQSILPWTLIAEPWIFLPP